jgi:hypothetical protein
VLSYYAPGRGQLGICAVAAAAAIGQKTDTDALSDDEKGFDAVQ